MLIDTILHSLWHSFSHTWTIIPILYAVYYIVMNLERKISTEELVTNKANSPLTGALLGVVPQCGVAVVASDLFNRNKITVGTLLAVFISSSDEALIILFTGGDNFLNALLLILIKVILAIIFGFFFDKVFKYDINNHFLDDCSHKNHCECCETEGKVSVFALKHTLKIFLCVYIVFFIFDFTIALVGKEFLQAILLTDSFLQPLISALIGLIPSCAVSIIIASLYLSGGLSFGSTLSGLISAAGFGLIVLIRGNQNPKLVAKIILALYCTASLAGVLFELLF
ncbi:MAG: putative manganese transporter [Clostridia bacterium]